MENFYVLSRPYHVSDDQNGGAWRVQALEFPNILLHNDRTLHKCIVRVSAMGRTYAAFPTEDHAYMAINDYYVMCGEQTPYVRVGGVWRDAGVMGGGQTTDWIEPDDVGSQPMEFE